MVHFVKKLRQLKPDMIVGQPAYGYPAVPAESDVVNASWNVDSTSNNVADSVGLMVYEGTGNNIFFAKCWPKEDILFDLQLY